MSEQPHHWHDAPHLSRSWAVLCGVLCLWVWVAPSPGGAQDTMDFEPDEVERDLQEAEPPAEPASPAIGDDREELRAIYGDDPLFGTKLQMERHMGVYLVRYPQRDETERIAIKRRQVEARVWVSIGSRSRDELVCRAVRWLVFGRTRWALGARGVFSDYDDVRSIALVFTNVRLRDGRRGRVKKKVHPYLELTLTRRDFERLDTEALKEALEGDDTACVALARRTMSRLKFDDRYFNAFKADR